ncbi:MAG: hypothetical protein WC882_02250 [Candidatus Gracilibacteria bacterium]
MRKIFVFIGFLFLVGIGIWVFKTVENNKMAYYCETDADCMNSCAYGTLNVEWYAENIDSDMECLDGCNGPWSAAPQCILNVCTAFLYNGEENPGCTRQ